MPFRDITGHRRLLDLLARSIGRGTLPQSLIFAGPSHVGKRATAVALASSDARHDDDREAREIAERVLAYAAATSDAAKRLDGAKTLLTKTGAGGASDREQLAWYLRAMASLLRDVEVLATRADPRVLANPDAKPALERLASVYQGDRGVRAFTAIDQALVALDRNAGVKVLADWVVL